MKKIILPVLALLMSSSVFAQNYYIIKKTGTGSDYTLGNGNGAVTKILTTGNDILSSSQTIPFTWNYYGSPVTSFKATDNGYITFDAAASTTTGINTTLPDAGGPNNAIYAFWDDLELKTYSTYAVDVRTWTTGTAGNRMHYIQWMLCTKNGVPVTTAHALYFAIRLKETGGFDVIHNYGFGQTFSATVGCENSDGSVGVMDANSPNINTPSGLGGNWANSSDVIYEFHYGVQPAFDPVLVNTNLAKYYKVGAPVTIGGNVVNYGSSTITKLNIYYSIDGGAPQTYTMTGLGLLPGGASTSGFSHNIPWTSGAVGTLSLVKVWIGNPNGSTDGDSTNNETSLSVLRNKGTSNVERNVLFEEATGGWCGYCPDGHLIMKDVVEQNPDRVIPVMHHNSDLMSTTEGDKINAAYAGGYPDGFIDRTVFPANRGTWAQEITNRLSVDAPVKVTIAAKNYNPTTRTIVFRVTARFSDYWAGDLRIGAIVSEDEVRGNVNQNNWSQHNYYSKYHASGGVGGSSHPLYNELEFMDGYRHQHVTRGFPNSSAWGLAAIIPDVAEPDVDYSFDFTYVVGAETKVSYTTDNNTPVCSTIDDPGSNYGWNKVPFINLIGFVAEYDGANVNNRPILNAGATRLWNIAASLQETAAKATINSVYPNPAKDYTNIKINLTENTNVKIEVFNAVGQLVSVEQDGMMEAGDNNFLIKTTDLSTGIYTINVTTANGTTTTKLNVVK